MLVLLAELAVTPVALDQLLLAGDLLGLRVDVLDHPRVALDALPVVGAVVAAERRQLPVAQLPDAVDRGVEEGTVVRRDEQRTRPAAQVLLEPFEGVEVEVIGRLVEEEQVRIGDDQPCQRRPRLLSARQRRRRLRPFVTGEAEPAQRALDALVERVAAEDLVLVQQLRVGVIGHTLLALHRREPLGHPIEMRGARPDGGPQVRRGHERLVEMGLLGEQSERQASLAMDLAAVGLVAAGGKAEERGLARAVRADEADPVAQGDRGVDRVEDHERPDLARDTRQAEDAHRTASRGSAGAEARAAARRVAAARFVRSVRARDDARAASCGVSPTVPSPARSVQRPPDRRGPPVIVRRIAAAPLRSAGAQPLAPRAEMGRSRPDDDPLDRPAAARARLAGALVDLQVLLHRAIAVGRGVVVDRASAPHDRLGQDPPDLVVQMPLVRRAQRAGRPERVESGRPQRLVGVDVADPGDERLVEQERLEPARPLAQPASEVADRERRVERLGPERREDRAAADLGHQLAGHRVAAVEPDLPELADVAEAHLAAVGQLEDEPHVRVHGCLGRDDEQLAGHLEVDGQGGIAGQVDDDLLGAPPDGLDPSPGDGLARTPRACGSGGSVPTRPARR